MKYQIENKDSGHIFGIYEGADEQEALDNLAQDAGYKNHAEVQREYPEDELLVTKVKQTMFALQDIKPLVPVNVVDMLKSEGLEATHSEPYHLRIFNDRGYLESYPNGTVVFFPELGRAAIEFGADWEWADVESAQQAAELFLNNYEEWERRN